MAITSTVPNLAVPVTGAKASGIPAGLRTGWQTVGAGTTNLGL
jgi:hypothetical protein